MNSNHMEHSYEELRQVVISLMLDANENGVNKFDKLLEKTALELGRRDGIEQGQQYFCYGSAAQLHPNDTELLLEIIWDLFRQGIVTLGRDASNPGWPWLRLSRFGESALQQSAHRLHNKAEFLKVLRSESIDISPDASVYLREAVAAFYTDCLLSTCVMLGIAAESEFLRLLDVAKGSKTYGRYFSRIGDGQSVRTQILRFQEAIKPLKPLLSQTAIDELGDALNTMQSILRTARDESGKPSGPEPLSRDQVYVYLQLFIPFAQQLTRLRRELTQADYPRAVGAS